MTIIFYFISLYYMPYILFYFFFFFLFFLYVYARFYNSINFDLILSFILSTPKNKYIKLKFAKMMLKRKRIERYIVCNLCTYEHKRNTYMKLYPNLLVLKLI